MSAAIAQYGLYDTEDGVWMGTKDGPILHGDFELARVAAQMCDVMLAQRPARTRAMIFPQYAVRLRDEKKPVMTAEKALEGMESGRYI
jgi:hypothetical protein